MRKNIKERAAQGLCSYGLNIALSDPVVIMMAARAGFDFVRLDCEHMMFSDEVVKDMIYIARGLNMPIQLRVADLNKASALLDLGASGLMVPHTSSREKAIEAVMATKYAPYGQRGMTGSSRALNFGEYKLNDYATWANDDVSLIVQIEDKDGLEHIDEILSVPGIDMVATGKNDLAQALGVPGQNNHPDVIAAEDMVIRKALEHGKYPTLMVKSQKRIAELYNKGVRCFSLGRDESLLFGAMKDNLAALKLEERNNHDSNQQRRDLPSASSV